MLLLRQRTKLAMGANDEEHAMSQNFNIVVAVIGIDIGKNPRHLRERAAALPYETVTQTLLSRQLRASRLHQQLCLTQP